MKAGDMKQRVVLQRRRTTQSASGAQSLEYDDVAVRWAGVEPLRGREAAASMQRFGRVQTRFRLRSLGLAVDTTMRLAWGTRLYNIVEVLSDGMNRGELVVTADELTEGAR